MKSADHLPVMLKRTMGKTLYEKITAKVSEGTKVGRNNALLFVVTLDRHVYRQQLHEYSAAVNK